MASITLTGSLLDPDGFVSIGDQVRFTHKSNTGSTIKSAVSVITIPPSGNYNITLQYGIVRVEYKDILTGVYKDVGVVTVNQDNPATTLPELLNAAVPPSSQEMIEFQAILADCVQEANNASQSAAEAEQAVVDIEALTGQQTTTELINSSTSYDADKVLETSGFNAAGDGCAGKWKQNGVTGQTPSQTPAQTGKATFNDGNGNQWELVREKNDIHLSKLGAKEGDDITDIFKAAVSEIANNGGKIKLPYALEDNPCKISSTVTIRSDVTVYGESVFNSWLKQEDNANTNLLNAQNRDNNCFRDFSVDLNGSNNTAGNSINAGDCTKLKLINLSIKDAIKNIVLIQDCTDFNMSNVSAYGGGYYPDDNRGYELAGVENFNIKNISTKDYTGAGINLSRCNNGVLSGLNFTRDFSQGFTNGFAGVRFSNSSSNITLGDFYI
ncbi:MAG: hypothetical protein GY829_11415, partial [Gammaproteobacteria bacterium]|nr:hypothetical protein [Gammaproteobacteria bacterium]